MRITPTRKVQNAGLATGRILSDLQDALHRASPLEAMILLPLIERTATLRRDIEQFCEALLSDEVTK